MSRMLDIDHRKLVSRADLHYDKPVSRSEDGLPVGNGRMGSLVWTSPSALKFQINRVDVYANNSYSNSFPQGDSAYGYGCGFVDVDFVDFGEDVFPNEGTLQHLSAYDGLVTIEGKGIKAQMLASNEQDVIAIRVTDERQDPTTIHTDLRMLRHLESFAGQKGVQPRPDTSMVKTRNHMAVSKLHIRGGIIVLTQEFVEEDYYCSSAVAIGLVGRKAKAKLANQTEARLAAEPGKGSFTILIASAASFDREEDVVASALNQLEAAAAKGYDGLVEANTSWWHDFWAKSFVHLHSEDGVADYVEENYTYFLYVMASSSRGKFPPRYGGMIWSTGGDYREWGAQQWWHNLSCYYRGLFAANRLELLDPMFDMYTGMYDACTLAARQQWGSKGVWIPETHWFDGLAELPDDIAEEMRELYLMNKPWEERSIRFREYAEPKNPFSSRWNWKDNNGRWVKGRWTWTDRGHPPHGPVTHILSTTAKIAYLYWLRYEYTLDTEWLRGRAYPMLRGVVEFYRSFPNVKKEEDGKYHIHHVNNHEPLWDASDPIDEISAMRGVVPIAVKASEILKVDSEMRLVWQEFLDNLAPFPTNDHPDALTRQLPFGPRLWTGALRPVAKGRHSFTIVPCIHYDLCTLETKNRDPELFKLANDSYEAYTSGSWETGRRFSKERVRVLERMPIAAALLGRADDIKVMIPSQIRYSSPEFDSCDYIGTGRAGVLANRMTLREGIQAIGVQRLGRASEALQLALCQSVPAGPGQDTILRVFAAWPKDWDAEYTLLCRGGFLVTSSMQKGQIEFVEVQSQAGQVCRIRNPWPEAVVKVYRNGKAAGELNGGLFDLDTSRTEQIVLVRKGTTPQQFRREVPAPQ